MNILRILSKSKDKGIQTELLSQKKCLNEKLIIFKAQSDLLWVHFIHYITAAEESSNTFNELLVTVPIRKYSLNVSLLLSAADNLKTKELFERLEYDIALVELELAELSCI